MSIPVRGLVILIGIVTLPLSVILIGLAASQSPGAPDVGDREPIRISGSDDRRGSLEQRSDQTTDPTSTDRNDMPPPAEDLEQATAQVPGFQPPSSTAADGSSRARSEAQTTRQIRPPVQTRPAPPGSDPAGADDEDDDDDDDEDGDDDDEWDDDD